MHSNWDMNVNSNDPLTLVKNKRILSFSSQVSSTSTTSKTPQTHNYQKTKLFQSTNRIQILSLLSQDVDTGPDTTLPPNLDKGKYNDVFKPPPPIFVRGITNFLDLSKALIELIRVDNFFCKASADRLKIQTANPESY
jgi:hypothetical protein